MNNLSKRGIRLDNKLCVTCDLALENFSHLFFTHNIAWSMWNLYNKWVGQTTMIHNETQ